MIRMGQLTELFQLRPIFQLPSIALPIDLLDLWMLKTTQTRKKSASFCDVVQVLFCDVGGGDDLCFVNAFLTVDLISFCDGGLCYDSWTDFDSYFCLQESFFTSIMNYLFSKMEKLI